MKKQLEELLNDAGYQVEQRLKLSEQTFEFACAVQERFAKGDPKTKKEILTTMGSNLILKDKKLLIEARKPFFILGNTLSPEKPIISPIEPEKTQAAQWAEYAFLVSFWVRMHFLSPNWKECSEQHLSFGRVLSDRFHRTAVEEVSFPQRLIQHIG